MIGQLNVPSLLVLLSNLRFLNWPNIIRKAKLEKQYLSCFRCEKELSSFTLITCSRIDQECTQVILILYTRPGLIPILFYFLKFFSKFAEHSSPGAVHDKGKPTPVHLH